MDDYPDDTLAVFGMIKDIFVTDSSFIAFEYQRYETLFFSSDLLAYEVAAPVLAEATEVAASLLIAPHIFLSISKAMCSCQ